MAKRSKEHFLLLQALQSRLPSSTIFLVAIQLRIFTLTAHSNKTCQTLPKRFVWTTHPRTTAEQTGCLTNFRAFLLMSDYIDVWSDVKTCLFSKSPSTSFLKTSNHIFTFPDFNISTYFLNLPIYKRKPKNTFVSSNLGFSNTDHFRYMKLQAVQGRSQWEPFVFDKKIFRRLHGVCRPWVGLTYPLHCSLIPECKCLHGRGTNWMSWNQQFLHSAHHILQYSIKYLCKRLQTKELGFGFTFQDFCLLFPYVLREFPTFSSSCRNFLKEVNQGTAKHIADFTKWREI